MNIPEKGANLTVFVLVYNFLTSPLYINYVHDLDFNYFQQTKLFILYYFRVRLGKDNF